MKVRTRKPPPPGKTLKTVDFISAALFLAMVICALLQVLFRFVIKISVPWTEEKAKILYIWIIFIGAVLVESEDNQIKTTYFLNKLPLAYRFVTQAVINVMCILFEICLLLGAVRMFREALTYNFGTMPFLPTSILYLPVIASAPLVIWYLLRQLICYTGGKDISDEVDDLFGDEPTGKEDAP